MRLSSLSPLAATAVVLVACSDTAGPTGSHQLQVRVRVTSGAAGPGTVLRASPQGAATTTVEVTGAMFVLGGVKLETAALDNTVDWVMQKSVVIPLDFTGTPILAFDTDVPPGIYKELEVSIDKLEVGNPAEQPLIDARPQLADASVLIEGVVTREGGRPETFAFTAPLDIDLELPFARPIELTDNDSAVMLVSLTIDVSGWFARLGTTLDPTNPTDRSPIESNIQASLDLLEDG